MHNLEDCVRSQMSMRIDGSALAINYGKWKVGWVDTAAEQKSVVIVDSFVIQHCQVLARSVKAEHIILPFAPMGPVQLV